jgi:hypothetical protein
MTEDSSADNATSFDSGDNYDVHIAYTVDRIIQMYSVGGSVWLATQSYAKTTSVTTKSKEN